MKWVGLFQVGILLEFSEGDSPGGGVWWVGISRVGVFQGGISIEPWNICKKRVNTFVFVSRGVAL